MDAIAKDILGKLPDLSLEPYYSVRFVKGVAGKRLTYKALIA